MSKAPSSSAATKRSSSSGTVSSAIRDAILQDAKKLKTTVAKQGKVLVAHVAKQGKELTTQAANQAKALQAELTATETRDHIVLKLNNGDVHYADNTFLQDFYFYMCNEHYVLGTCLAHRLHPYRRWQRAAFLFVNLNLGFLQAVVFEFIYDDTARYWASLLAGSLVLSVQGALLRAIAQCACLQGNSVYTWVRKCGNACGNSVVVSCAFLSVALLWLAAWLLGQLPFHYSKEEVWALNLTTEQQNSYVEESWNSGAFLFKFCQALLLSWLLTSPIISLLYFVPYRRDELLQRDTVCTPYLCLCCCSKAYISDDVLSNECGDSRGGEDDTVGDTAEETINPLEIEMSLEHQTVWNDDCES